MVGSPNEDGLVRLDNDRIQLFSVAEIAIANRWSANMRIMNIAPNGILLTEETGWFGSGQEPIAIFIATCTATLPVNQQLDFQ